MTIPQTLYTEINNRLLAILSEYKDQMSQYDMLVVATNLLTSTMEVISHCDHIPREQIIGEIVQLINTCNIDDFISRN